MIHHLDEPVMVTRTKGIVRLKTNEILDMFYKAVGGQQLWRIHDLQTVDILGGQDHLFDISVMGEYVKNP